mgnify:CR=1 FL=1
MIRWATVLQIASVLVGNWMLQTGAVVGDAAAARAAEAKELYEKAQYEEALGRYRDAQLERPESGALNFNLGDVLYRLGQQEEALEQFGRASTAGTDPELKADAWFNAGKTFFQREEFDQAVEAFKQVLQIDSQDIQAKLHLELAQERLDEQERQNQEGQENKEQEGEDREERDQGDQQQDEAEENRDSNSTDREQGAEEQRQDEQSGQQNMADEDADRDGADAEKAGPLDREEAERLLDALQDLEKQAQMRRAQAERGARGKDW